MFRCRIFRRISKCILRLHDDVNGRKSKAKQYATNSNETYKTLINITRPSLSNCVYPRCSSLERNLPIGNAPGVSRSRDESNRSGVGEILKSNTTGDHGDPLIFDACASPRFKSSWYVDNCASPIVD